MGTPGSLLDRAIGQNGYQRGAIPTQAPGTPLPQCVTRLFETDIGRAVVCALTPLARAADFIGGAMMTPDVKYVKLFPFTSLFIQNCSNIADINGRRSPIRIQLLEDTPPTNKPFLKPHSSTEHLKDTL
jgi:hypothetical protein